MSWILTSRRKSESWTSGFLHRYSRPLELIHVPCLHPAQDGAPATSRPNLVVGHRRPPESVCRNPGTDP